MDGSIDEWTDQSLDEWMGGWIGGWMDELLVGVTLPPATIPFHGGVDVKLSRIDQTSLTVALASSLSHSVL